MICASYIYIYIYIYIYGQKQKLNCDAVMVYPSLVCAIQIYYCNSLAEYWKHNDVTCLTHAGKTREMRKNNEECLNK